MTRSPTAQDGGALGGWQTQSMVPAQCYERVLRVNVPGGHGSGFTINRHGRQWLVTAQHVIDGVDPSDIEIVRREGPVTVGLERVPPTQAGADVAAFLLDAEVTPDLALFASSDGAVFSQDAYFLGYPYGLGLKTSGVIYPFVKKAIVSAFDREIAGITLWFFDGINNPGFSGGPVVFNRPGTQDWHVAAVVSGYRTESVAVDGGAGVVPTNTGIIVGYDVCHATEAIDAHAGSIS